MTSHAMAMVTIRVDMAANFLNCIFLMLWQMKSPALVQHIQEEGLFSAKQYLPLSHNLHLYGGRILNFHLCVTLHYGY